MKNFKLTLAGLFGAAVALSATAGNPASKNVIDAAYRPLPADWWNLVKTEPELWNSNFRPYDPQFAEMLWSDSTLVRSVELNATNDLKSVTALAATCDEAGFSLLVYVVEPKLRSALEEGKARPANMLEMYFAPGDSDCGDFEPYYQFLCQSVTPHIWGVFPWLMEDRTFRTIKGHLTVDVRHQPTADVLHARIPWEPLFAKLPWMKGKKDNLYRLSAIRWASTGGQTWGGNVHQMSTAGYLRFPQFTEEQKTAIMKHLLVCGWDRYNEVLGKPRYSFDLLPVNSNTSFVRDEAKWPHTQISLAADRAFREQVMRPMTAERGALGKKIAAFETLPYAEREAFYKEAAPKLFNFEYDLQQAWGKWQEELDFVER